jgi:hypothetical protein
MTADGFLDGVAARFLAGLIGLAALIAMAFVWLAHTGFDPAGNSLHLSAAPDATADPAFIACRDQRLADIDAMLKNGVITEAQRDNFAARAVSTCAGRLKDPAR